MIVSDVVAQSDDDDGGGDDDDDDDDGEYEDRSNEEDGRDDGGEDGGDDGGEDYVPDDKEDFVPADDDDDYDYEDEDDQESETEFRSPNYRGKAFAEPEVDCNTNWQLFTQREQSIVNDLIYLDSNAIRYYPYFMDLSFTKIKIILHCLHPFTLQKVLLNIPQTDLINIYYGITDTEFNKVLNRLHYDDEIQIKSRLY